jgi:nucleoside-diphosphate-sugar epimerase
MKCLVTGASGSVGSRIVKRLLEEGHEVRGLVRKTSSLAYLPNEGVEIVQGDMTDLESLEAACAGCQWIFHSAAPVDDWVPAQVFEEVNVEGTRLLLEACDRRILDRFVFISSVNVYGVQPPPNTNEETPLIPCGYPYCDTKIEAERILMEAHRDSQLPITILRPANIWGPTATSWTIRPMQKLLNGKVTLIDGGGGSFNPIYVDNLAEACLLAAQHPEAVGEAFIITDGIVGMTFKDYFDLLSRMAGLPAVRKKAPKWLALIVAGTVEQAAKITGKRPFITRFVVQMLTKNCYYDTAKSKRLLNYRPRVSQEQAFAETQAWLREAGILPK